MKVVSLPGLVDEAGGLTVASFSLALSQFSLATVPSFHWQSMGKSILYWYVGACKACTRRELVEPYHGAEPQWPYGGFYHLARFFSHCLLDPQSPLYLPDPKSVSSSS